VEAFFKKDAASDLRAFGIDGLNVAA